MTMIVGAGLLECASPTNVYTFVSKYATAAHLALLTVAPLFLSPFLGDGEIAKVLLWLSLVCATWVVMSPSVAKNEHPHDARVRFASEVSRDPMFWLSLLLVVISGFRALNGGVRFSYDPETYTWAICRPIVDIFPGCVDGAGLLPFASCVALLVLLQGLRHALDRQSQVSFFVSISFFAGLSAIVSVISLSYGNAAALRLQQCAYLEPSFLGVTYGISLLCGIAAMFCSAESGNFGAELLTAVSTAATTLGVVVFSPVFTLGVFAVAFVAMLVLSYALHSRALTGAGSLRCTLAIFVALMAATVPFLLCDNGTVLAMRRDQILSLQILPAGFGETRAALSAIALRVWKSGPWLGSGLGSFPLDIRFAATSSDWAVISPLQKAATNGWWQLLAERGVVGALMFATVLGLLLWTYVANIAKCFACRIRGIHFVGPLALLSLVAVGFVDCSFLRVDVLLAGAAVLALSAAAFPIPRQSNAKTEEIK